jgi:hypothetical protein
MEIQKMTVNNLEILKTMEKLKVILSLKVNNLEIQKMMVNNLEIQKMMVNKTMILN